MEEIGYWLLRSEGSVLTLGTGEDVFPRGSPTDLGNPGEVLLIGRWRGQPCYAAEIDGLPAAVAGELTPLRRIFSVGGAEAFALAGRASQLLDWQRNHRYCGACGAPTERKPGEFAMVCPACELIVYPRLTPAVMVLVLRAGRLLLARGAHFVPGMFSALAGFVEAGETLEQCAAREVREEVGIEITRLRYFRSQSWPFPNSLMVAFFADYAAGTLQPDQREIEAADWFSPSALPDLPGRLSIARQLIEAACQDPQP